MRSYRIQANESNDQLNASADQQTIDPTAQHYSRLILQQAVKQISIRKPQKTSISYQ